MTPQSSIGSLRNADSNPSGREANSGETDLLPMPALPSAVARDPYYFVVEPPEFEVPD